MRVYELAKELGKESEEVLAVLAEAGIDATAPANGISDDEADEVRAYFAEQAGGGEPTRKPKKKAKQKPKKTDLDDYAVLVGKGKVFCGAVLACKGDAVTKAQYDSLPERVQGYFEKG